jgi:Ni/Co efflux regulator RcnB
VKRILLAFFAMMFFAITAFAQAPAPAPPDRHSESARSERREHRREARRHHRRVARRHHRRHEGA